MARSRRGEKVTPNLVWDAEGTRALNLSVLRRLDPAVSDILITAAHVVAYNFDRHTGDWVHEAMRKDTGPQHKPLDDEERPLHRLSTLQEDARTRNAQPRFQLVVMNRLNTENLVEDLLTDFQYEMQVPYLMYHNAADEIIGVWFYDPQECHEVAHLFSRIQYAFSRTSPKASCASKSDFEELEVASAVPAADTLEQSPSPTIVPDDTKNEFLAGFSRAAACVGDTIGGSGAAAPNQSFRSVPSPSHQPKCASASPTSALHNLLPSLTSSVHMSPFDAYVFNNSAAIQPSSLLKVNPALLPPTASTQTTTVNAASSSLSVLPPLHPPLASHQPQSVTLHHHPYSLPMASPPPPCGMPLLQPFPPPKPSPLLTPAASYVSILTRDQVKGALSRLVQILLWDC